MAYSVVSPKNKKTMKNFLFVFVFLMITGVTNCKSQTINSAIDEYFEMWSSNIKLTLNHGPLDANIGLKGKSIVFFVSSVDPKNGDYENFGILFDAQYRFDTYVA